MKITELIKEFGKMEKYCPKCGRVYKDKNSDANVCMYCAIPLEERPGRIQVAPGTREAVFRRDGYRCQMCGASRDNGAELELDHITPVAKGGTNDIDNLQTLCKECNRNKADLILPSGLKIDIEIKQNELNTLTRLIQENKDKLKRATNENDELEFIFNIKHLEEQLPTVNKELNELKIKYQEEQNKIRIEKENREKQDRLFKKLFVKLSPMEILILKDHFNLNHLNNEVMLKTISKQHSEHEILKAIEDYKIDLHQTLDNSITFNMLPLISSELSINESSKNNIINHLTNNYTKSQIYDLIDNVKAELFNQYAASFNNIEKIILKQHYSLNNISDAKLINYVIENDYSIDELKNTLKSSYKSIFQEYYNQLDEYQKYLVIIRFENHGNNLVDFLAIHNFSLEQLKDELKKTKLDLFNKTLNSLNYNKRSLIEKYSLKHSTNFDLIDYFYKNKFSYDKITELVELSKKDLHNEVHQNLNNHEMFLFENTFETEYSFINFMVEHEYSMNSLRKKLKRTQENMEKEIDTSLDDKQKFLLKKYFSKDNNQDLINYIVNQGYDLNKTLELSNNYKKELYDEFDNNLNYDYEKILYNYFSLKTRSKDDLIDYLIYKNYNVQSMDRLIRDTVFLNFNKLFNKYSVSHVCYKLNRSTNKADLYEYLFKKRYTYYATKQLIKESEKHLTETLKEKLDFRSVQLINKDLNLPNSKNNLISYLMENYTVDSMRKLLRKYDIEL